jgi:hypothetical protein
MLKEARTITAVKALKAAVPQKTLVEERMYALLRAKDGRVVWSEGTCVHRQNIAGSMKIEIDKPLVGETDPTFQIVVDRSQPLMISKADFVEGPTIETLEKYSPTSRFRRRDDLDALNWEVSLNHWKSS